MLRLSANVHDQRIDGDLPRLSGELGRIAALRLDSAEICAHGLDAIRAGELVPGRAEEFASIVAGFPLETTMHAPEDLDLMSRREPGLHEAVLDACLRLCEISGCGLLVLHPGRWVPETDFGMVDPWWPGPEEERRMLEDEAARIRAAARRHPLVRIALENARPYRPYSPCTYAEFPDRLARQVREVGEGNVGCCLDTGHLHLAASFHGFDEAGGALALAPSLVHLHVHDNFGRTGWWSEKVQTRLVPFGRGDLHMPPGAGDIDFDAVLGPLVAGWDGTAVLELRPRYLPGLAGHVDGFRRIMGRLCGEGGD